MDVLFHLICCICGYGYIPVVVFSPTLYNVFPPHLPHTHNTHTHTLPLTGKVQCLRHTHVHDVSLLLLLNLHLSRAQILGELLSPPDCLPNSPLSNTPTPNTLSVQFTLHHYKISGGWWLCVTILLCHHLHTTWTVSVFIYCVSSHLQCYYYLSIISLVLYLYMLPYTVYIHVQCMSKIFLLVKKNLQKLYRNNC